MCNDKDFLSNYKNCLQCAGPDNVVIWQYYGDTLSAAGEKCDLDTKPADGKQNDVAPAISAEAGASSSSVSATSSLGPQRTEGGPGVSTSDSGEESTSPTVSSLYPTDLRRCAYEGVAYRPFRDWCRWRACRDLFWGTGGDRLCRRDPDVKAHTERTTVVLWTVFMNADSPRGSTFKTFRGPLGRTRNHGDSLTAIVLGVRSLGGRKIRCL